MLPCANAFLMWAIIFIFFTYLAYNLSKYIVNVKGADVYRTIQFTAPSNAFHVGDTLTFTKVSK